MADQCSAKSVGSQEDVDNNIHSVRLTGISLDEVAIEVGVYFMALTLCMFMMLDKFRAKPSMLKKWLIFRKIVILPEDVSALVMSRVMAKIAIFYIVMPIVVLILWVLLLIYDLHQEKESLVPAICVFFVGIAIIVFGYGVLKLKLSLRFKTINLICLFVSYLLLTVYQGAIIFTIKDGEAKFFPYSAFFLNFNASIMACLVFAHKYQDVKEISEIIEPFFPKSGAEINKERKVAILTEIEEQSNDPNWKPSEEEFKDVITIAQVSEIKYDSLMGGGFIQKFNKKEQAMKNKVKIGLLAISIFILIVYAIVVYMFDCNSKMGIVISVSIVFMDAFTFILDYSNMISNAPAIITLLLLNRSLMIGLGDRFWIYGYMILYIIYAVAFIYIIAKNNFPFSSDIILKSSRMGNLMKRAKNKSFTAEKMLKQTNPVVFFIILSIFFFLLMVAAQSMEYFEMKGIKLNMVVLMKDDPDLRYEMSYMMAGGLSILMVSSFYFFVALVRIMIRTVYQTDLHISSGSNKSVSFKNKYFDIMQVYMLCCFVCCCIWSGIAYWITRKPHFFLYSLMGPLILMFFARAYVFFSLNEYEVFQNVDRFNKHIDFHNKKIDEMEKRKALIQEQLLDGTLVLPQLEDGDLQDGKEIIERLIEREKQKLKDQLKEREDLYAANPDLKQQELERRKQMEAQIRNERVRDKEKRDIAQEEMARQRQESEQRQKAEELKRRQENQQNANDILAPNNRVAYKDPVSPSQPNDEQEYEGEEIYEGGSVTLADADSPLIGVDDIILEDLTNPDKIFIDRDDYEDKPGGLATIACTRLNRELDWRLMYKGKYGWVDAFRANQLRPNDLKFLRSLIACFASIFFLMILSVYFHEMIGFMRVLPSIYLVFCILTGSSVIYQSRSFSQKEIIIWVVVHVVYCVLGAAFLFQKNDGKFLSESTRIGDGYFILFYILFCPTIAHFMIIYMRIQDRGIKGLQEKVFKVFMIIIILGIILMILCTIALISTSHGLIAFGAFLFVSYLGFQVYLYVQNKYHMDQKWKVVNRTIAVVIFVFSGIYQIFDDDLSQYEGVSYSMMVGLIMLWGYAAAQFSKDYIELESKPVFYTGSIFPMYKYEPKLNLVHYHYRPALAWILGLILVVYWGFLTNLKIKPKWVGPVLIMAIQLYVMLSLIAVRSMTLSSLLTAQRDIDENIAKQAWIESKRSFIRQKGAFSQAVLMSYRRAYIQKFYINAYLSLMIKEPVVVPKDHILLQELKEETKQNQGEANEREYYKEKVEQFKIERLDTENFEDMSYQACFNTNQLHQCYREEQKLIFQFLMISVQNSMILQNKSKKELIKFLDTKKDVLYALGIGIRIPSQGSFAERYDQIEAQIQELPPEEIQLFGRLKQLYEVESKEKQDLSNKNKDEEQAKQDERERQAEEARQKKEEQLAELARQQDTGLLKPRFDDEENARREQEAKEIEQQRLRQLDIERQQQLAEIARRQQEEQERQRELMEQQEEMLREQREMEQEAEEQRQIMAQIEEINRRKREQEHIQRQLELQQAQLEAEQQRQLQIAQQREQDEEIRKRQSEQIVEEGVDIHMDIDQMPDCKLKYKIIVARAMKGMGKFYDNQFPPNDNSIGDDVIQNNLRGGYSWHRLSEKQPRGQQKEYCIFEGGVDCNDIKQGALGDCYFLSALSVLGTNQTREKFVFINSEEEWKACGAFCVKFFNDAKEDIIIIDDHFLFIHGGSNLAFVHTPSEVEIWPCILEKAFAKKYGSYTIIEGGMVDIALSELTNGIPETFDLAKEKNVQVLWDKTLAIYNEGNFLGAGSPSHPDGDSAKSSTGIVQGHAYSILKLIEVDGTKLIMIRNPWGDGEWTGDWSDDSELWTIRMQNLTGYTNFDKADGVFWMDYEDFLDEFSEIYVCRIYNEQQGWKELIIEDEWTGIYAQGLPSKDNRNCKFDQNPQYGLTINGPGKGFLVLRMKEKTSAHASVLYGYLNIQKQNGKKITNPSRNKIGDSGPINSAIQTVEVEFGNELSYPYVFTCLVANFNGDEGKYAMQVYSRDMQMQIKKIN